MSLRIWIAAPLLFAVAPLALDAQQVTVQPDPRTELLTIIFRLAGSGVYNQCRVPRYAAAIDSAFAPFRHAPAVEMARRLEAEHGVGFDAVQLFALSLTAPPTLVPRAARPGEGIGVLDPRWDGAHYRVFADSVRAFAHQAHFAEFYRRELPVIAAGAAALRRVVDRQIHVAWFGTFFGATPGARFIAIPGTCNGGANYGPHFMPRVGRPDYFAVIGMNDTTASGLPTVSYDVAPTIVHEFAHSYANGYVDSNLASLHPAGDRIFRALAGVMIRQAYTDGEVMLKESLVRATVVQYRRDFEGEDAASREIREQVGRGFIWMRDLDTLLSSYHAHRAAYPTFARFMPRVIAFFDAVAQTIPERIAAMEAARPRIAALAPRDSGTVSARDTLLAITFDRPMDGGYSLNALGGMTYPDVTATSWSSDHKTFRLRVHLKPGVSYGLQLSGAGFQSPEGFPMIDRPWQFTTTP